MSIEALLNELANLPEDDRKEFLQRANKAYPDQGGSESSLAELYGVNDEDLPEILAEFEAVERGEADLVDAETFFREIAAEYGLEG